MEHLDLAGFITTPTHWTMPAFEQQDAVYLSNSRQMLEPILEETSEDEEHAQNSWSQYEHNSNVWSSAESETGSVIRIEVTKDADSISERDFACPAKRARRSEECLHNGYLLQPSSLDDTVLLRRFQPSTNTSGDNSLERFLAYESQFGTTTSASRDSLGANSQQRSSTGSRRFDDFYSDSDSLSYHSLSRSSSLIQFESLERQLLQEQHSSLTSLGNSSPSLLSFEGACLSEENHKSSGEMGSGSGSGANSGCNSGNNSRRGSQSSLLRRFESADGRLHQTYYDLDKLNFDDTEENLRRLSAAKSISGGLELEANATAEVKSDSESSTSSSSSSGKSILNACKPSTEDLTVHPGSQASARISAFQRAGGKNSAENLSEDSGYCEPSTLRRSKSKSIPKNFEKFCEEEEFYTEHEHKAIEISSAVVHRVDNDADDDDDDNDDDDDGGDPNDSRNTHSKNSTVIENDLCQPKIALDATFVVDSDDTATTSSIVPTAVQQPTWLCFDSVKNSNAREPRLEQQQQQQPKQARSLAHSPSPVSDAGSTTSSASCASANSFTWLPTHTTQQPKQQQQQQQQLLLNNLPRHQRLPSETSDFSSEHLQNSLPDIRDANGSTFVDYFSQTICAAQRNGYVVDSAKLSALGSIHTQRKSSLSDSDNSASDSATSTTSSSTSSSSHSGKTKTQSSVGGGGRVASVPNELDKIGNKRNKRNKAKYNKSSTATHSEAASSESEHTDEDFFDGNNARIRRSCSWSERRERNLQKFEGAFGEETHQHLDDRSDQPLAAQSLGYMNASYHNLTLLDYSGRTATSKSQSNFKRSSMDSRQSSGDYESIICKGNFLLDELSEIYDKNASILNDQQLDVSQPLAMHSGLSVTNPKAAARQSKHSNSDCSDLDTPDAAPEVQHIQLTIRKPPARQKHGSRHEAPTSLVSESSEPPIFNSFGKTFDQDPTNLRTSYAQSLEKCNFDAKELSNADLTQSRSLPKRRFQSHAAASKKRNLVSSTPNLNAYDPQCDELEDDIYVSSAHTSMHQLPQGTTQKPLGILIPTGSRSSFSSKEVSFCPVVSKYSWQEQSSEECNEPSTSSSSTERPDEGTVGDRKEEDSDDELLDNADATVIYNTKENEMIATRYAEQQQQKQEKEIESEKEKAKEHELQQEREQEQRAVELIREQRELREIAETEESEQQREKHDHPKELLDELREENIAVAITSQQEHIEEAAQNINEKLVSADVVEVAPLPNEPAQVSHKTTPSTNVITLPTRASDATSELTDWELKNNNANATTTTTATTPTTKTTPRPLSLHLPILSEPPTNRAHILYASQQLIDSLHQKQLQQQQHQLEFSESAPPGRTQSAYNLNSRQQVENNAARVSTRMSNLAVKCSESNHQLVGSGGVDQSGMKHYNNNNELVKSKFKADEKHPSSKGFLSRFANGFRFSLRRNKKKQQQQQLQQQQQQQQLAAEQNGQSGMIKSEATAKLKTANKTNGSTNGAKQKSSKQNSPDFIYIPLKGPLPADAANTSENSAHRANESQHVSQPASEPLVTGKPPLPKQPPRLVEKLHNPQSNLNPNNQQQQSAGPPAHYATPEQGQNAANFTATNSPFYTNAKPTTIDESFLDSERLYYDEFRNQLNSGMHANGRLLDAVSMDPNAGEQQSDAADATQLHFSSPSRATVSQKTQMFNNMSNGRVYVKNTNQSGGIGSVGGGHGKIGLIETNLDTHETVISGKTRSLMELGPQQHQQRFKFIKRLNANASGAGGGHSYQADLVAVDDDDDDDDDDVNVVAADGSIVVVKASSPQTAGQIASVRRPHKSMEFLLDKENQKNVLPPENELQKSHDQNPNALSEHQLRVQASLQRLNIPDWFRHYNQTTARSPDGANAGGASTYKPGNFSRKRTSESSGRWTGLNSKTTSLSSLGSQRSDRSPLLLSPSAHSHHGGQTSVGAHQHHQHHAGTAGAHGAGGSGGGAGTFSRWSTSHLNSSQTSPSCSQRGSFSRGGPVNSSFISVVSGQSNASAVRSSFRQPYLGWRSQEKLSQRTPHERLASSLLSSQPRPCSTPKASNGGVKQHPVTPEIQSSIKEVTSAIVHYVNDQTQQQRSRSTSPNSRKCWLESSFVGTRPLDSPQTPVIENTTTFSASAGAAAAATAGLTQFNSGNSGYNYNYNYNSNSNNNNSISSGYYNNSSATSSIYSATTTTNADVLRMNGLSCGVGESAAAILI